jgi:hypothetical protein
LWSSVGNELVCRVGENCGALVLDMSGQIYPR